MDERGARYEKSARASLTERCSYERVEVEQRVGQGQAGSRAGLCPALILIICSTTLMHAPDLPAQLVQLLQTLSDDLVAQRLAQDASFDPQLVLAQSAPLFAALHAVNRDTLNHARDFKARTQDARLEMDSAHLRLQVGLASSLRLLRGASANSKLFYRISCSSGIISSGRSASAKSSSELDAAAGPFVPLHG